MCHLILLLPIFGLVVFWLLPLDLAIPVYILILVPSILVYFAIMRAMRRPVSTGREGLINEIGRVVKSNKGEIQVLVHGEIWNASSSERLHKGQSVRIVGVHGLSVKVESADREENEPDLKSQ